MGTVKFNALADETTTTFVLEAEEAQQLGRGLVNFAEEVLAERRKSGEDTIRRMEESHHSPE